MNDWTFEDADGTEYGLVMPFVVVHSHGGPYEDEAFVAGWELGRLDLVLAGHSDSVDFTRAVKLMGQIRTAGIPQADLISMRHGWKLTADEIDPGVAPGWSIITLERDG